MNPLNIEFDFEGSESNQPFYRACTETALESLRQAGTPAASDLKFVFTNKISRANSPPAPRELVFFMTESKALQRRVEEPHTVIPRDGLDHLPRVIAQVARAN